MPHLHLPADHSDADLVLAASVAATVGAEDLYVAWTHDAGAGAVPEVEALVREDRPNALATIVGALLAGVMAVWHGLTQAPVPAAAAAATPATPARETFS
jgi:hypothetical protein